MRTARPARSALDAPAPLSVDSRRAFHAQFREAVALGLVAYSPEALRAVRALQHGDLAGRQLDLVLRAATLLEEAQADAGARKKQQ